MEKNYSKGGIIALCSLIYFVSYFTRKDFAAVMEGMISENAITKSLAGLALTMLFIFYGAGQLISGYLGDCLKPSSLIAFGLSVTALCNLFLPLANSDVLMVVLWGINGFAQAMLWPPIVKILSSYLDHERYVTANLIVTSAAHTATILLYFFVPVLLNYFSWEAVFFLAAAIAGLALLIFIAALGFVLPREPAVRAAKPDRTGVPAESILQIFRRTGVFPILICIIMCGFLRDGIESWLPTLYSEVFDRDASESILVSVILPIFSMISISAIKAVHRFRLFNNEISGAAILFSASAVICIPLAFIIGIETMAARSIALVLTALVCAAMHGVNFLLISCLPGRFSRFGRASTVSGLTNSCIYIGAAAASYGIAFVSDHLGWTATIVFWTVIALIGVMMTIPAYKRYTNFISGEA